MTQCSKDSATKRMTRGSHKLVFPGKRNDFKVYSCCAKTLRNALQGFSLTNNVLDKPFSELKTLQTCWPGSPFHFWCTKTLATEKQEKSALLLPVKQVPLGTAVHTMSGHVAPSVFWVFFFPEWMASASWSRNNNRIKTGMTTENEQLDNGCINHAFIFYSAWQDTDVWSDSCSICCRWEHRG